MAITRFYQPVPNRDPVVGADRLVSLIWQRYFDFISAFLGKRAETRVTYDPTSISAGSTLSVAVPFVGARPGDFAYASHTAVVTGITIVATATTDSVTVTFQNVTGGALDLDSGTLRVRVESVS